MHLLSAPEGLANLQVRLLSDVSGASRLPPETRAEWFAAPPVGNVEDRWAIYVDGYLARIVEALENDYPALRRVLGEGPFSSLAARYVAAYRPRSYDLGQVGDRLPKFLRTDPLQEDLPFLADLASLEWLVADAFVASDPEPLEWEELAALGPVGVLEAPLALVAGTAVIRSQWPLLDIWRLKDVPDEEVCLDVASRSSTVLVYRRELQVRWREIDAVEARIVAGAQQRLSLEAAWASSPTEQETTRLIPAFQRLVVDGVFSRATLIPKPCPNVK